MAGKALLWRRRDRELSIAIFDESLKPPTARRREALRVFDHHIHLAPRTFLVSATIVFHVEPIKHHHGPFWKRSSAIADHRLRVSINVLKATDRTEKLMAGAD